MSSKSSKPPPDLAAPDEKPAQGLPPHVVNAFRRMEAQLRRVDELIRAQERQAAAPVVSPVFPPWAAKLKPSLAAMTEAVAGARAPRGPRRHSPDGVVGGDEKRLAFMEAQLLEIELQGDALDREIHQIAAHALALKRMAESAVRAGDDDLARELLALRRECLDSLRPLRREEELVCRICDEYSAFLDDLRQTQRTAFDRG
jgi:hypothetical protein